MARRRIPVPGAAERALDAALDKALSIQRPVVLAYLDRVRGRRPTLSSEQLVEQLERRYVVAVTGIGAAAGGSAALPGVGSAASVAAGAAEIGAFVSATGMYVLALAELHQLPVSDPEVRRALVLGVLVGSSEPVAFERGVDRPWAQVLNRPDNADRIGALNTRLGPLLISRFGARQGALLLGRALPFGIGAGVGALGNAALAKAAITAARRAFGPPPPTFPPRIVDVRPRD